MQGTDSTARRSGGFARIDDFLPWPLICEYTVYVRTLWRP